MSQLRYRRQDYTATYISSWPCKQFTRTKHFVIVVCKYVGYFRKLPFSREHKALSLITTPCSSQAVLVITLLSLQVIKQIKHQVLRSAHNKSNCYCSPGFSDPTLGQAFSSRCAICNQPSTPPLTQKKDPTTFPQILLGRVTCTGVC